MEKARIELFCRNDLTESPISAVEKKKKTSQTSFLFLKEQEK